jgi:hypothetical protein
MERAKGVTKVLRFACFYPGLLLYLVEYQVYLEEQRRIQGFLQVKHQEYIQDTQKAIEQTGIALQQFTEVTVFPPLQQIKEITTRRTLRERCISNGISPQLYNEFYRLVDGNQKEVLLNDLLARECSDHKEKCEGFASVAQLLLL